MAQAIMQAKLKQAGLNSSVKVDSAGTIVSKPGQRPDIRAVKVASQFGVKIRGIKSRKIKISDFERFDFILVMDRKNCEDLMEICPAGFYQKVSLIMDYAPESLIDEVPDPYFGNINGFTKVFDLLENACGGFIAVIFPNLEL